MIVKDLIKNYYGTVIFASHNLLLRETSDRIVYLRAGRIEKRGV